MSGSYYVYIYRDLDGNPLYVGQGLGAGRAGDHRASSHNPAFDAWLRAHPGAYRIEVLGPLGSKKMADAVETAVISACKPAAALRDLFFNEHPGRSEFRFRPYGVPDDFAARIEQPLIRADLDVIVRAHGPVMFVRINQEDFEDGPGRVGYDLADPPTDAQIKARVESWWQVKKFVPQWSADPDASPALLVGVTGGVGSQLVIACARVDRAQWAAAETQRDGLLKVPLVGDDLDAAGLRGRPIPSELNLRFNAFRHSQFRLYGPCGFTAAATAAPALPATSPAQAQVN